MAPSDMSAASPRMQLPIPPRPPHAASSPGFRSSQLPQLPASPAPSFQRTPRLRSPSPPSPLASASPESHRTGLTQAPGARQHRDRHDSQRTGLTPYLPLDPRWLGAHRGSRLLPPSERDGRIALRPQQPETPLRTHRTVTHTHRAWVTKRQGGWVPRERNAKAAGRQECSEHWKDETSLASRLAAILQVTTLAPGLYQLTRGHV